MTFQAFDLIKDNCGNDQHRKFSPTMSNADKIFARAIVKRQLLVVKDLMALDKTYPSLIDKDVIGGLYALYTLLEDNVDSITVSR